MEPLQKKAKITGHFRVALKPQNISLEPALKKFKQQSLNHGKENVEVITISDDEDDDLKQKNMLNRLNNNANKATNVVNCFEKPLKRVDTNKQPPNINLKETLCSLPKPIIPPTPKTRTSCGPKQLNIYNAPPGLGCSIQDHDKNLLANVFCEPYYAWDIFRYYREQELKVQSRNYFISNYHSNEEKENDDDESTQIYYTEGNRDGQPKGRNQNRHNQKEQQITPQMRSELVDWLVFLQNHFALDHEVLYMAVKIADQYLMRKISLPQPHLPLLYITSFLISVKFDERIQPCSISELIYESKIKYNIRYSRRQVIRFEADILNTLDFELRFPLSYGFLRRYATCTRSSREILNLARYILESSLLNHDVIDQLESKLAAASLLLAFEMLQMRDAWDETAEFYTGYKRDDIKNLSNRLNNHISLLRGEHVRRKYQDEVFMSVARIPPLTHKLI